MCSLCHRFGIKKSFANYEILQNEVSINIGKGQALQAFSAHLPQFCRPRIVTPTLVGVVCFFFNFYNIPLTSDTQPLLSAWRHLQAHTAFVSRVPKPFHRQIINHEAAHTLLQISQQYKRWLPEESLAITEQKAISLEHENPPRWHTLHRSGRLWVVH